MKIRKRVTICIATFALALGIASAAWAGIFSVAAGANGVEYKIYCGNEAVGSGSAGAHEIDDIDSDDYCDDENDLSILITGGSGYILVP